jgi:hypothetical protein
MLDLLPKDIFGVIVCDFLTISEIYKKLTTVCKTIHKIIIERKILRLKINNNFTYNSYFKTVKSLHFYNQNVNDFKDCFPQVEILKIIATIPISYTLSDIKIIFPKVRIVKISSINITGILEPDVIYDWLTALVISYGDGYRLKIDFNQFPNIIYLKAFDYVIFESSPPKSLRVLYVDHIRDTLKSNTLEHLYLFGQFLPTESELPNLKSFNKTGRILNENDIKSFEYTDVLLTAYNIFGMFNVIKRGKLIASASIKELHRHLNCSYDKIFLSGYNYTIDL